MTEPLRRWRLNKTARKAVVLGSLASSFIALHRATGKPRVRAKTSHRFGHVDGLLGKEVAYFVYPFGMRRDESPLIEKILAKCGYSSISISRHGTIEQRANPLRLPRIKVQAGDPLWMFKQHYKDGMDAWGLAGKLL